MTITTTAPTITATGISAPSFSDVFAYLQAKFRAIYGADAYLDPDSQDGQFLAVIAQSISDANAIAIAIYNSFSPATAQGAALSSQVKINGIARDIASFSTVDVLISGTVGTTITNGVVTDSAGNRWSLPPSVTLAGTTITVTATCQTIGAIPAAANTVTGIATPTRGWASVTNPSAATAGAPVETDAQLRQRQTVSTALPSQSILDGLIGAVSSLTGVARLAAYENPTGSTDGDGVPAHAISLVVDGGDASAIAEQIALKKTPGTATYGTTTETVSDAYGDDIDINFYRPTAKSIDVAIDITSLAGYNSGVGDAIKAQVAAYINALAIGQDVLWTRLFLPANLMGSADGLTYEITSLEICLHGGSPAASDVAIAFNEAATCDVANITLTVT